MNERIKLTTQADLTEASYETAIKQLCNELKCKTIYVCLLTVNFWDADLAINIMGKYRNCDLMIDRNYPIDSWSVSYNIGRNIEIYSEGA